MITLKSNKIGKVVEMLTSGDLLKFELRALLNGQTIINTFYYLVAIYQAGVDLLDCLTEFVDVVLPAIQDIQVSDLNYTEIVGENLTNGVDVETLPLAVAGTDLTGGPVMPTYVAGGFKLNVPDKTTRAGQKRFAGIGEDRVTANTWYPTTARAEAVANALALVINVMGPISGELDLAPIVVGRTPTGALDLTRYSAIVSATWYDLIRSQVSRRRTPA